MIRIHFTTTDLARVRFSARPAPIQELNTALMTMMRRDDGLIFGSWRQNALRSLPDSVLPLRDLVPAGIAPGFIDVFSDTLQEGLETVRSAHPTLVRSELERVYARHASPPPPWVQDLRRGDMRAWRIVNRAQHAAFETLVRPVWSLVQDLHQAEFTRHALTVAEHGIGSALSRIVPGSRMKEGIWEFDAPGERDIQLDGRGILLLPTFHWTAFPLIAERPDQPVGLTYPAGTGIPLSSAENSDPAEALSGVLGHTRVEMLLLLAEEHNTTEIARKLGISNATASTHATALRRAGLIGTVRAGKAVLHRRTTLGNLLLRRWTGG